MFEDKEYFSKHKYKHPDDYVVKSYVLPKIEFMAKNGCFGKEDIKILDVGSGNGTFSWYFSKYTKRVISLDYSKALLESNSSRLRVLADGYALPFKDNEFDMVFEANLLHHLDDPYSVIKEMRRCSSRYIVLVEPNRYNPLMFLFSLAVSAERGTQASCRKRWSGIVRRLGMEIIAQKVTGMISQQNTPAFMVPFLKLFDFDFCLGEYIITICRK